jgi:hypothetical protein
MHWQRNLRHISNEWMERFDVLTGIAFDSNESGVLCGSMKNKWDSWQKSCSCPIEGQIQDFHSLYSPWSGNPPSPQVVRSLTHYCRPSNGLVIEFQGAKGLRRRSLSFSWAISLFNRLPFTLCTPVPLSKHCGTIYLFLFNPANLGTVLLKSFVFSWLRARLC